MHTPPPNTEAMEKAIKLGHEPSGVSIKGVVWFLVCLALTIVVTFAFVWVVWRFLIRMQQKADVPNTSLTVVHLDPQGPLLQPSIIHNHDEHEDLDGMHDRENQTFSKMGWMLSDGRVRVSDNIANQVIQLTKEKGVEGPTYNGWATPGNSPSTSSVTPQ